MLVGQALGPKVLYDYECFLKKHIKLLTFFFYCGSR